MAWLMVFWALQQQLFSLRSFPTTFGGLPLEQPSLLILEPEIILSESPSGDGSSMLEPGRWSHWWNGFQGTMPGLEVEVKYPDGFEELAVWGTGILATAESRMATMVKARRILSKTRPTDFVGFEELIGDWELFLFMLDRMEIASVKDKPAVRQALRELWND